MDPKKYVHTATVPVSDIVLTPHEVGDLAALWAMVMCHRDSLIRVEGFFPTFRFSDRIDSAGKSITINHDSPLSYLKWWETKMDLIRKLEGECLLEQYVAIAMDVEPAMAAIASVDWFITRYRCRPPDVSSAGGVLPGRESEDVILTPDSDASQSLQPHERLAIDTVRNFDQSGFDHLSRFGEVSNDVLQDDSLASEVASASVPRVVEHDSADMPLTVERTAAKDGYREEDRLALQRFREYIKLVAHDIPPILNRWQGSTNLLLGQKLFAYSQLLFASSFPNAEAARRREEEIKAEKERQKREAEAKMRPQE